MDRPEGGFRDSLAVPGGRAPVPALDQAADGYGMALDSDFLTAIVGVNASVLIAVAVEWRGAIAESITPQVQQERRRAAKAAVVIAGLTCMYSLFYLGGLFGGAPGRLETIAFCLATMLALVATWFLYFHEDANAFVTWIDHKLSAPGRWRQRAINRLRRRVAE